jgi:cell wall-associated NlpC family hydrolase/outer membrane murein-binding lipoprotein Lpp
VPRLRAHRREHHRPVARTLLVALAALVAVGLTPGLAAAKPKPGPTNAQINAARSDTDALADQVAQLTADLDGAGAAVEAAQEDAAIALDDYQEKQAAYDQAHAASDAASSAAATAAANLQTAREQVASFARHSYIDGSTYAGAASLITASGPAQLAERAALLSAAGSNRTDVLGDMAAAQQQAATSAADAQASLAQADSLRSQAQHALGVASAAERSARQQQAGLAARQADLQGQLTAAQAELTALIGAKAAADRLARAQAATTATRSTTPRGTLAGLITTPAGPGNRAAAQKAIAAAKGYLGTRYAWGGGGSAGPGRGIDLDANVVGFDCSGLTQYAYAKAGIAIPRNSRSQFALLKKVASSDLEPGDLVFWAVDPNAPTTIHHVAIYLGGNQVLQAPQSGDVIKISSMWWGGYAGAVRPSA